MDLPIEDVVELGQLCATYAVKLTQGDIHYVIEHLCTDDGTYSAFGETYSLDDWPALVAAAPKGLFLCGEPALQLDGDEGTGEVPLLFIDQTNHRMRMGWYSDTYRRTADWLAARHPHDELPAPQRRRRLGQPPRPASTDAHPGVAVVAARQDGRPRIRVAMRFFWIWAVPPITLCARL